MEEIDSIIRYISERRAIDFSTYRQGTIRRRLQYRIGLVGKKDYKSYLEYLKEEPSEIDHLIDCLFIKVSEFFRDPIVFEVIASRVFPELFSHRENIRVWSAWASRGEEAYSIAIILKELSIEFPQNTSFIIATDIDREAIE